MRIFGVCVHRGECIRLDDAIRIDVYRGRTHVSAQEAASVHAFYEPGKKPIDDLIGQYTHALEKYQGIR